MKEHNIDCLQTAKEINQKDKLLTVLSGIDLFHSEQDLKKQRAHSHSHHPHYVFEFAGPQGQLCLDDQLPPLHHLQMLADVQY